MDVTRVAGVTHPRPVAGWPSRLTISLAALVAIGFFVGVALPYLTLDQAVLARYASRRLWVLAHIAGGGVALLTGPNTCRSSSTGRTGCSLTISRATWSPWTSDGETRTPPLV